ncbi:MBOAT family O-acyltransferase [Crassaminicella profunda]|uniref:MBOAT family O-acyltransferase n=1 Tax=Crassaminicella profunda TaxID=1286698 RepID=UPI001CA7001B|nr:MBOAT family O-acyltransferase [Crassaminicella profunda]QZY55488.1 MBOAT family protein [Crassaminicella profunda]
MLFNSFGFLVFFPIVITLYFIIPYRARWIFLLGASYYFYMCWNPKYIVLIIISTIIDYFAGMMMGRTKEKKKRKKYLLLSLVSNLGLLFTFKYFNFFNESIGQIFRYFHLVYGIPDFKLLLPVGISFYTFQTLSYSIDVYKGKIKPEKHLGIFALYVSFFPQLVAGPIERSDKLLPQFYEKYRFDYDRFANGLVQMGWGFFKKVVIADRVAILVNQVYNNVTEYTGIQLIVATVFFTFQIYCDFSGYSDIAIGLARILGFDLMKNFNRPYGATSIPDFWRRWHISLSTWFKDYLYIPLGGSKTSKPRWYFNLSLTFLISGLWHGANWTFILWGCIHGFYQMVSISTRNIRSTFVRGIKLDQFPILHRLLNIIITFLLVCFAWIFFRANNLKDAIYIVTHLFEGVLEIQSIQTLSAYVSILGLEKIEFFIAVGAIALMEIVQFVGRDREIYDLLNNSPIFLRWAAYYIVVFAILLFGVYGSEVDIQFIYFQF